VERQTNRTNRRVSLGGRRGTIPVQGNPPNAGEVLELVLTHAQNELDERRRRPHRIGMTERGGVCPDLVGCRFESFE
jgi:hypothetical protein